MNDQTFVARFSDGQSAASRDVSVQLTDRGVIIILPGEDKPLVWPYGALSSSEPLSDYSIDALLSYSYQPGAALFVPDPQFARRLHELAPHLHVRAQRWRHARPWIWAAVLAGLAVMIGWMAQLSPSRAIANLLPDGVRDTIGKQVVSSMTENRRVCSAAAGTRALQALTEKLSKAAGGGKTFEVVVVDWDLLNAFATPGDKIVLTRGLIAKAASADEVAGVLAHEMGHGIELHPETGIVRAVGLAAGMELLFGGTGGTLANAGLMLAQLSYSREAEREADEQALRLLRGAQISSKGLLDFFDRILTEEKQDGDGGSLAGIGVLRTHPLTEERKERVAREESYESSPSLDAGAWADLQAICSEAKEPAPRSTPRPPWPGETDI